MSFIAGINSSAFCYVTYSLIHLSDNDKAQEQTDHSANILFIYSNDIRPFADRDHLKLVSGGVTGVG